MTLDEAIRRMQAEIDAAWYRPDSPFENAAKLAIEAMRLVKQLRPRSYDSDGTLLPGETEE